MTPEQLAALTEALRSAITGAIGELRGEIAAQRAAPPPQPAQAAASEPAPTTTREAELEAKIAKLEATVSKLENAPMPVGFSFTDTFAALVDDDLVDRTACVRALQAKGMHAIAAHFSDEGRFARAQMDYFDDESLPERRKNASADLRSFLRAAEADGLLKPAEFRTTQGWE